VEAQQALRIRKGTGRKVQMGGSRFRTAHLRSGNVPSVLFGTFRHLFGLSARFRPEFPDDRTPRGEGAGRNIQKI
jgi:hypothetical protein